MTVGRAVLLLLAPLLIWLLSLVLLMAHLGILYFVQTRIVRGILDGKQLSLLSAMLGIAAVWEYDRKVVAPVLSAMVEPGVRHVAELWIIGILASLSLLIMGLTFHYSMTGVTKFNGRSSLIFPKPIYRNNPQVVRHLWIRLFTLNTATTFCVFALLPCHLMLAARGSSSDTPDVEAVWIFLAGLAIAAVVATWARELILNYPSQAALLAKVNYLVSANSKSQEHRISISRRKSDPFGWGRSEMIRVARILERLARRVDSGAGLGSHHPLAALYKAAADHMRRYCASPASLNSTLPFSMVAILISIEAVSISDSPTWRNYLTRHLDVFDEEGKPRALQTAPYPGRFKQSLIEFGRLVNQVNLFVQDSWKTIVIVLALAAFAFGKLSLDSLVGIAK
ncbi:hypothetical protein FHU28_005292 [Micromonospora echinospora]|uniref:Uncharacterized protein n=1 Tax=Micromonospora echinospora TaxID=1877 RepID=A0ABR6MJB3_MICEC|nr:hypothetical protein [Micromonospora echinospora]MBB5115453.1 hypothetical protein [Micromonospora echinospora]